MGQVKRRMLVNAACGGLPQVAGLLVSLFMIPFVLGRLGTERYSILPLVNSLVAFLMLVSLGVHAALGRYVTYHMARDEDDEAGQYLSTGFGLLAGLAAVALVPLLILVAALPRAFQIPGGFEAEARWVALILGLNCLVDIAASPLGVPLYATQRLALRSLLNVAQLLLRAGLIVAAFLSARPRVLYVALATLASTLVFHAVRYRLWRALVPRLRAAPGLFRRERVWMIFSFSTYTVISTVGVMIFLRADLLLANWMYGGEATTYYSLAGRWNPYIRGMLWSILAVAAPVVTALDAVGDRTRIREAILRGMRYGLLLCALPCVLLPLFAREFIETWVADKIGTEHVGLVATLLVAVVASIPLVAAGSSTKIVLRGMGRVRFPAFVTLGLAVLNIILSIYLATAGGLGLVGIPIATIVCCFLSSIVIYPFYSARVLGLSPWQFYGGFVRPALACVPMVGLALWLRQAFDLAGWGRLLAAYAACSAVYAVAAYVIGLRPDDRALLGDTLRSFRRREAAST
jgi:O-antigen/teichoic acid export membrane protein